LVLKEPNQNQTRVMCQILICQKVAVNAEQLPAVM
jgi:hypothetical protein